MDRQYPENCSKNQKRTIRRKASRFEVADGELYLKKKKKYQKVKKFEASVYVSYCSFLFGGFQGSEVEVYHE